MILSQFYEAIMKRICENIPEVKHFDMYFGQDMPDEEGKVQPFLRPAVFFEFDPLDWESMGSKVQASSAPFKLKILADVPQEIAKNQTENIRNLGHKHLEVLDKVHYWMHGFSGEGFNTISRTGMEAYKPNGMMMGHDLKFKTRLTDTAAVHAKVKATPGQLIVPSVIPTIAP